MWLLAEFAKADFKPSKPIHQAFTTKTDASFYTSPPHWQERPFVITNPAPKAKAAALEEKATAAAAATNHPSHPGGDGEARALAAEARDFRGSVSGELRALENRASDLLPDDQRREALNSNSN